MVFDPSPLIKPVIAIVDAAKKVCRFKNDCQQLSDKCSRIHALLEKHPEAVQTLQLSSEGLRRTLESCHTFVIQCQSMNLPTVVFEATFRERVPKLREELSEWLSLFQLETTVRRY
jgi:hypothetical protein